jgi:hypothetical protein
MSKEMKVVRESERVSKKREEGGGDRLTTRRESLRIRTLDQVPR